MGEPNIICPECQGAGKTTHRKQGVRFAPGNAWAEKTNWSENISWDDEIICPLCNGEKKISGDLDLFCENMKNYFAGLGG